ncbi:hypothetical protein L1887_19970 [Cichorium endivia]|nr:hypothetical protein L1887_19970 [Cichorium endivia]
MLTSAYRVRNDIKTWTEAVELERSSMVHQLIMLIEESKDEPVLPVVKPRLGRCSRAGCFTEEKAKQLRMKTVETVNFHDMMYHSAIASRLASDVSGHYSRAEGEEQLHTHTHTEAGPTTWVGRGRHPPPLLKTDWCGNQAGCGFHVEGLTRTGTSSRLVG